ncbi:hypothetical protein PM082_007836 [Marasmius tenuissimus]|nr:hypothetical protein PM082_007836 [Marasmius tenuissimus]
MVLNTRLHLLATTLWLLALLSPSGTLSSVVPANLARSFEDKHSNNVERGCLDSLYGSCCVDPFSEPGGCCPAGGCS